MYEDEDTVYVCKMIIIGNYHLKIYTVLYTH